jgi:hypothetical protein
MTLREMKRAALRSMIARAMDETYVEEEDAGDL